MKIKLFIVVLLTLLARFNLHSQFADHVDSFYVKTEKFEGFTSPTDVLDVNTKVYYLRLIRNSVILYNEKEEIHEVFAIRSVEVNLESRAYLCTDGSLFQITYNLDTGEPSRIAYYFPDRNRKPIQYY